ncbi:universal stress protein UspA [Flavobacterium palustre]|uniref:Universal stress protein UspA n=1 Tax=Flavobacterium palustre TaxID=1476463 RepID=A0ABQ1HK16_9FLAO|nr:universal stress protein [Flavobacterium palustre]GGA79009.1 universal stress protein UspA [Flavobacterium palustre]
MKRILVPTDFSTRAENALKAAAQIARKNNCEIHLLHMLEIPSQMNDAITGGAAIPEIMLFLQKAKETMQFIKEKNYLQGITVIDFIQLEKASHGILSFINKEEIDLVVMGSNGVSGIEELILGSNTEKVVRLSPVPVIVIKEEINDFNPTNIVFASDFSEEIKKPFQKILDFAKLFDAKLNLVTICTPNSFKTTAIANKILNEFISKFEVKNYSFHIYNDLNIEKGIIHFAKDINTDLISLCTHGRTGLSHFFTGSISEDLANHASKPLLVLKI